MCLVWSGRAVEKCAVTEILGFGKVKLEVRRVAVLPGQLPGSRLCSDTCCHVLACPVLGHPVSDLPLPPTDLSAPHSRPLPGLPGLLFGPFLTLFPRKGQSYCPPVSSVLAPPSPHSIFCLFS